MSRNIRIGKLTASQTVDGQAGTGWEAANPDTAELTALNDQMAMSD